MAKIYEENTKLKIARSKIFGNLDLSKTKNILEVLELKSGDYLPTAKMVDGKFAVYGGGGETGLFHNHFNADNETIGIGRVGARCGCVFKIQPKSWITDNALFAYKIDSGFDIDFLIHFLNYLNINQFANTAAQPVISLKRIKHIEIPKIELSKQKQIGAILNKIEKSGEYYSNDDEWGLAEALKLDELLSSFSNELTYQQSLLTQLRQAILQEAVQGKLVPQHPDDEPASALLDCIRAEKAKLLQAGKMKKEKALPPIRPEEVPFALPEGWVWCRLGEISPKIGSGSTPKGGKEVYVNNGIKFFRSQNIYNTGLVLDDIAYINSETHQSMNGTMVFPNDVLLNITGGSIGRAALVPSDFDEGNVSQHVCIVRPIKGLDSNYLHHVILSPYFQKLIIESTTGAGREGLPKYNLERFPIPLPPLAEQRRMVVRVQQLLGRCAQLEQQVQESRGYAGQLLQAVLQEAFGRG